MIPLGLRGHGYTTRMGGQLWVALNGTRAVGIVHWRYQTDEGVHSAECLGDMPSTDADAVVAHKPKETADEQGTRWRSF